MSSPQDAWADPAKATDVTDRIMKMEDCVKLIDAASAIPVVRGPFKKRKALDDSN